MNYAFFTMLVSGWLLVQPCQAQSCELVQRIEAKDGTAYVGIVDIPTDSTTGANQLFMLMVGKSITPADTTYMLHIGINAVDLATDGAREGMLLQFEDGSTIIKPRQVLEATLLAGAQGMLSAQVDLTPGEIDQLKHKRLVNLRLAASKVVLFEKQ